MRLCTSLNTMKNLYYYFLLFASLQVSLCVRQRLVCSNPITCRVVSSKVLDFMPLLGLSLNCDPTLPLISTVCTLFTFSRTPSRSFYFRIFKDSYGCLCCRFYTSGPIELGHYFKPTSRKVGERRDKDPVHG